MKPCEARVPGLKHNYIQCSRHTKKYIKFTDDMDAKIYICDHHINIFKKNGSQWHGIIDDGNIIYN